MADIETLVPVAHQNRVVSWKVPWYTLMMFVVYMSMYFEVPEGTKTYTTLALRTRALKEAYRWWTYSLLHLNAMHLGVNMMTWFIYGGLIEWDHGPLRCASVQILSILGGACGFGWEWRLKQPSQHTMLVGVSGGVYGMLASQIGNLMINWIEIDELKKVFYVLLLLSAIVSDVTISTVNNNAGVSYSAHIGGFITGTIVSIFALKNIKTQSWERIARPVAACVAVCFLIAGFVNLGIA
jgi:membrane associated rhomboid family serine protease